MQPETPAGIELAPHEVRIHWMPDQQQVRVHFDPQFKTLEMVLMVLDGAKLQLETMRQNVLAQQRVQAIMQAQQEANIRQQIRLN